MTDATVSTIVGLQNGDEGKGMGVDRLYSCLSRREDVVTPNVTVRMNGTSQAAHNVVAANGVHHTFRQFGSGYLTNPNQLTYFHATMLVHPFDLLSEANSLQQKMGGHHPLATIAIHEHAPILLPIHSFINKLQELNRGGDPHGSCGKGLGVLAQSFANYKLHLSHSDLRNETMTQRVLSAQVQSLLGVHQDLIEEFKTTKYQSLQDDYDYYVNGNFVTEYANWLSEIYYPQISHCLVSDQYFGHVLHDPIAHVVFEMAQGALLDEWRGLHPHTTWSTTTLRNVHDLLAHHDYQGPYHNYGMMRAYGTRHGHGPFPSQEDSLQSEIRDYNNSDGRWQGPFRYGHLDLPLLKYGISIAKEPASNYRGIDSLMISCMDQVTDNVRLVKAYKSSNTIYHTIKTNEDLENLDYQQYLTDFLNSSHPHDFSDYPSNPQDLLRYLSGYVNKISFTSYSYQNSNDQVIDAIYEN